MEVFKTVPQSPHFSPLLVESREDSREMSAVGMMLTFFGLLDEVKALQHNDPISFFISLTNSFAELEKHGFNVKAPQSRINKLLSLRDRQSKKTEELKDAEKVTAEKESVKAENKRKILELQRLNEEMDKEIAQSKSCAAKIVQQLDDVKLEFLATASAPW
jgi:DNA polymerase II large subunit